MTNVLFQTDTASEAITKALDDFLRDKHLSLSDQQYIRVKKLLMVRLLDDDDLSYENAYNQLCDIKEHRKDYEIDANAPNEAQEEMIRIIGAADMEQVKVEVAVEVERYKKRFYITLGLLGVMCTILALSLVSQYMASQKIEVLAMAQVINTAEENTIKDLVQRVITLETKAGNKISHSAVYKDIKELDEIQSLGEARSYKKFNKSQYNVAVEYLNDCITKLE